MTSPSPRERFLAACRRRPVDRPPAWVMRQAGRSLPEYRALRARHSFMDLVHRPELATEVTLQPVRRFGMDAAVVFSDILVPAEAMGLSVEVIEGRGPVLEPPVRTRQGVERLARFDPGEATGFLAETLRAVRAELGTERALVGFCGAPFTLASYLVEGKSSRSYEHTKAMMLGDPQLFDELLRRIVDVSIPYLELQAAAGADALQVFDSWGGALSERVWRGRVLPHVTRLVAGGRATGRPVILYVNGGAHLVEAMAETGADVLSLDWRVEAADAVRRLGDRVAFQGNLDPAVLFAPPQVVEREVRAVLEAFAPAAGHVLNLGSGVLPETPMEGLEAFWRVALGHRRAGQVPAPAASTEAPS